MFNTDTIKRPSLLLEKDGEIRLMTGNFSRLKNLNELNSKHKTQNSKTVFITPFSVAQENGMEVRGNEDILSITVTGETSVTRDEIEKAVKKGDIRFKKEIAPLISDEDFADDVRKIQEEEIARGNACQVVYSRKFEGQLEDTSPLTPLTLFSRLLKQTGQYITFLFSDGHGRYFVGATPERQLEIQKGKVVKNPIAGTLQKGSKSDFEERLGLFLKDKKEMNELSQILDEEMKIMSRVCPRGGRIFGPFLRESGAVIHTEYHLLGHSQKPALEALRDSFHAPTLVGSPLESAFRIIAKREKESRRYYGGEIGVLDQNGDLYSAILIRTAEIFADGKIVIQAGAGIVRDSVPAKEAAETSAKAAGLVSALKGGTPDTETFLTSETVQHLNSALKQRNETLSSFHFEDQAGKFTSHGKPMDITIINNEDNFSYVLMHIIKHMGHRVTVADTFDFSVADNSSDLVIIGPGPGDINDAGSPRMKRLLALTSDLMALKRPLFGVCLGLQAICKTLGIPVTAQAVPTQGLQREIDFFGRKEKAGFYNSFSPLPENLPSGAEVSLDETGRIIALKNGNVIGIQFHAESAMTQNGYGILNEILTQLTPEESEKAGSPEAFAGKVVAGNMPLEEQKKFLTDMNERGFTGQDIAKLVRFFYGQMPEKPLLPGAVDLCGTGGSGLARVNTSTISAIILSSLGVPIAKHGNKAAGGRFGSFDLLEQLGINIMADSKRLEYIYEKENLAFIFARKFHPVFKHFAQVRQELGIKTIFNILGPLLNPADTQIQVIGTSSKKDMELIAQAAKILGKKHVLVLNGADGLDELTLTGETSLIELKDGNLRRYTLTPEDFGFSRVDFYEIAGGDPGFNTQIARDILSGNCKTAHLNLILANTALILKFLGKAGDYKEGVRIAKDAILSGSALSKLNNYARESALPDILKEIVENKKAEVAGTRQFLPLNVIFEKTGKSDRDFKAALSKKGPLNLIAEIKNASPSAGKIYSGGKTGGQIAKMYEESGADAISILTDEKYFKGSLENLRSARSFTSKTPLLMKDFIIDEYQIYLARYYGADAVLLIASILTEDQINWFTSIAGALNMDVLLEVHTQRELETALRTKADIIGINNRDLHTFEIDPKTFLKLYPEIPDTKIIVAESGYDQDNISMINGMANAALIGTALMKTDDVPRMIADIKTVKKQLKPCGIRTAKDAEFCEKKNIRLLGINFVPSSKRHVDMTAAKNIRAALKNSYCAGVFQNQPAEEVNRAAAEAGLDFVQLSGDESPEYCRKIKYPVIKTVKADQISSLPDYSGAASMFIIDGACPGSGKGYDYSGLKKVRISRPFLIAGGVDEKNAGKILAEIPLARGVDVASGIETDGRVDTGKIERIFDEISYN